jgi:hypothetical protein
MQLHFSPVAVVPRTMWSAACSLSRPRMVMSAASAHGRSASSAAPLSWLPAIATTWAPVLRSALSALVTIFVASGDGDAVS